MVDVTDFVTGINARKTVFGISFEQLILVLYPLFLIPAVFFWYRDLKRRRSFTTNPAGCVKLGVSGQSHAADEYDARYDTGTTDASKWKVKALYIHPIKSCSAVEVDAADVDAEGLTYDRRFCFAELITPAKADDEGRQIPKWTFRTLRQPGYEKLALIKPEVWVPKGNRDINAAGLRQVEKEGSLIVKYPNVPTGFLAPLDRLMLRWGLIPKEKSFRVPLNPIDEHPKAVVDIWKEDANWFDMGRHIPEDFKQWMGVSRPLTLFRADAESYRPVMRCAPRKEDVGFQTAVRCQDAYPVNMLNLASVHDVGNKVGKSIIDGLSVRRFRANIIVEGLPAYDEDDWKRCSIGVHELYCACHTVRCRVSHSFPVANTLDLTKEQLPNVDPDTAQRHPSEPDKTLKAFRCIDEGDPLNACLGMQMVPANNKRFRISVGDSITVLERGKHIYIKR